MKFELWEQDRGQPAAIGGKVYGSRRVCCRSEDEVLTKYHDMKIGEHRTTFSDDTVEFTLIRIG